MVFLNCVAIALIVYEVGYLGLLLLNNLEVIPRGPSTKDVRQNLGFSNHPPPLVRVCPNFQNHPPPRTSASGFFNFYTFLFLLIKTKFIAQFLFL